MTPLFKKFLSMNWVKLLTMLGLMIFGVFAVYSACHFRDNEALIYKWKSQIYWCGIGLVFYIGAALSDYRWVKWAAPIIYVGSIIGLILVHFLGVEKGGNRNWLDIAGFSVQPSQFAILAGIITIAVVLAELPRHVPIFRFHFLRLLLTAVITLIPLGFVLSQGDIGSAMVWAPVLASMWLVGMIPFRYLIALTLCVLTLLPLAYFFGLSDTRKARIETYLSLLQGKEINVRDEGWDIHHVTMAIGSAGWEGKGFQASKVPGQRSIHRLGLIKSETAINDYIFSVVAEEHGFRGSMILISALLLLLLQCLFIAFFSRDQLGRLIAVGTVAMLFTHIFQNIGMCVLLMPITGLPLPLISYGGTFMLTVLFLLGMTQSVWVHRSTPLSGQKKMRSAY